MDLRCFAYREISIFIDSCETLKGSFISLYKKLIVTINLVSAYTRSDVQVDCVRVRANCISYDTFRTRTPSHLHASEDFYVSRFNIYRIYG